MIFVMGGAYQGKEGFVKDRLIKDKPFREGYLHEIEIGSQLSGAIVIKSLEKAVKTKEGYEHSIEKIKGLIEMEKEGQIELYLIGEQIGSGIVPIEASDRIWRDTVGFFYQYLVQESREVYRLWSGIEEKLKG